MGVTAGLDAARKQFVCSDAKLSWPTVELSLVCRVTKKVCHMSLSGVSEKNAVFIATELCATMLRSVTALIRNGGVPALAQQGHLYPYAKLTQASCSRLPLAYICHNS